jgi:hypothetical protein
MESVELEAISRIIAATIKSTRKALRNRRLRNTASPLFPVGESARRQFHARARAPKAEVGEGSCVCGLAILLKEHSGVE